MKTQNEQPANSSIEMVSLNLDDLNVEELEHRLELATVIPTCLRSGSSGCTNNSGCVRNG